MTTLKEIYKSLNDNEKFGISFGLFPVKLMDLKLDNMECAMLVEISQEETGVEY